MITAILLEFPVPGRQARFFRPAPFCGPAMSRNLWGLMAAGTRLPDFFRPLAPTCQIDFGKASADFVLEQFIVRDDFVFRRLQHLAAILGLREWQDDCMDMISRLVMISPCMNQIRAEGRPEPIERNPLELALPGATRVAVEVRLVRCQNYLAQSTVSRLMPGILRALDEPAPELFLTPAPLQPIDLQQKIFLPYGSDQIFRRLDPIPIAGQLPRRIKQIHSTMGQIAA